MSDEEFRGVVSNANKVFDECMNESKMFVERIMQDMFDHVDVTGSLLWPNELIKLGDELKEVLFVDQFNVHGEDGREQLSTDNEYYRLLCDELDKKA
jgi:hypothetical protein